MQRKSVFASIVAILVLAGPGYSAWHDVKERSSQSCKACTRPVHSRMKTVAMVDGKRANYCCPACALSGHQQWPIEAGEQLCGPQQRREPLPPVSSRGR